MRGRCRGDQPDRRAVALFSMLGSSESQQKGHQYRATWVSFILLAQKSGCIERRHIGSGARGDYRHLIVEGR